MDWLAPVDGYCERLDPGFWAEPVNAVTNLAFVMAGLVMFARCRGFAMGQGLAVVLVLIGIGSGLFHTFANRLTGLMDVLPILGFILLYIYAATRDFLGARPWLAGLAVVGFLPFAAVTAPLFAMVPVLGVSAAYWPVVAMILVYAGVLRGRLGRELAIGAGILVASLVARSVDGLVCDAVPLGTHFLWHLLNAVMLAWMIEVWRRHAVAQATVA
jgi:hypothetical protein